MEVERPTLKETVGKTIVSHTITYFIVGVYPRPGLVPTHQPA